MSTLHRPSDLWKIARRLVEKMNPQEAKRFPEYVENWPIWAQNDVREAYFALSEVAANTREQLTDKAQSAPKGGAA